MSDPIKCPKCSETMVIGYIPEISHRTSVSFWIEGVPEFSFWSSGVKIPEDRIDIITYRCIQCGYLELYAKK